MGERDHSIKCETCGAQRGGLNDYKCHCTLLEIEVADLRRRLVSVEERVRLDANAHAFLRSDPRVREGDCCLIDGFPTRVSSISSQGKWTYFDGRNSVEPFRVPPSDDIQRLYTTAEVAEIIAKVRQESPGLSPEDVVDLVTALDFVVYGRNRASLGEESRWKTLLDRLTQIVRSREVR